MSTKKKAISKTVEVSPVKSVATKKATAKIVAVVDVKDKVLKDSAIVVSDTKKNTVALVVAATKVVMVNLAKTSYHYYRHFIKAILTDGKVSKFRFVKNDAGWHGVVSVDKVELDKAKKVFSDYKSKNVDTADLWW